MELKSWDGSSHRNSLGERVLCLAATVRAPIHSRAEEPTVISSQANQTISRRAKAQAESSFGGGIEKMTHDMESYGASVGTGGVSFLISHIPVVGPILAKGFDLAASKGLKELYKKLLAESKTPEQRISNALFLLENGLAASLRQGFNTAVTYDASPAALSPDPKDCGEAFKVAYQDYLALSCVEEIEAGCAILKQLAEDLEAKTWELKRTAVQRVSDHEFRYDSFRDNHPDRPRKSLQHCYWQRGPGTMFGSTGTPYDEL